MSSMLVNMSCFLFKNKIKIEDRNHNLNYVIIIVLIMKLSIVVATKFCTRKLRKLGRRSLG